MQISRLVSQTMVEMSKICLTCYVLNIYFFQFLLGQGPKSGKKTDQIYLFIYFFGFQYFILFFNRSNLKAKGHVNTLLFENKKNREKI